MFHFYALLVPSVGEELCRELCLPPAPGLALGLSAFVPMLGTRPSSVQLEPKERRPRGHGAPCSELGIGTGALSGALSGALQEQGYPESRGRVFLSSACGVMLCLVLCCPESMMPGDRSSSAHVLLWFHDPNLPTGMLAPKAGAGGRRTAVCGKCGGTDPGQRHGELF